MGSMSVPQEAEAPQQELPSPAVTRRAAAPYRSFTTSLISCALIFASPQSIKDELFAAGNSLRLDRFISRAALGIQKAEQFRQRLVIRRIAQKSPFPPHFYQILIPKLIQMMGKS